MAAIIPTVSPQNSSRLSCKEISVSLVAIGIAIAILTNMEIFTDIIPEIAMYAVAGVIITVTVAFIINNLKKPKSSSVSDQIKMSKVRKNGGNPQVTVPLVEKILTLFEKLENSQKLEELKEKALQEVISLESEIIDVRILSQLVILREKINQNFNGELAKELQKLHINLASITRRDWALTKLQNVRENISKNDLLKSGVLKEEVLISLDEFPIITGSRNEVLEKLNSLKSQIADAGILAELESISELVSKEGILKMTAKRAEVLKKFAFLLETVDQAKPLTVHILEKASFEKEIFAKVLELYKQFPKNSILDSDTIETTVTLACSYEKPELLKYLISRNFMTQPAYAKGLESAVKQKSKKCLALLIQQKAIYKASKNNAFLFALQNKDWKIVRLFIENGAKVNENFPKANNWMPLHFAVNDLNLEMVILLIKAGANVHATDDNKLKIVDRLKTSEMIAHLQAHPEKRVIAKKIEEIVTQLDPKMYLKNIII